MPPEKNIFEAMFDIRPVKGPGILDLEKIQKVRTELDLKHKTKSPARRVIEKPEPTLTAGVEQSSPIIEPPLSNPSATAPIIGDSLPEILPQESLLEPELSQSVIESASASLERPASPSPGGPAARFDVLEEFEKEISEPVDTTSLLASIGGQFYPSAGNRIRRRIVWRQNKNKIIQEAREEKVLNHLTTDRPFETGQKVEEFWNLHGPTSPSLGRPATDYVWPVNHIFDISNNVSDGLVKLVAQNEKNAVQERGGYAIPSEVDYWLKQLYRKEITNRRPVPMVPAELDRADSPKMDLAGSVSLRLIEPILKNKIKARRKVKFDSKIILPVLTVIAVFLMVYKGLGLRNNVIQSGSKAIVDLQQAKNDLNKFAFVEAADNFNLAYSNFNNAASTLDNLGASFLSVFENIPGLDKVKSANDLVTAGQHISKAGKNLALAFDTLSKTNFVSFFRINNQIINNSSGSKESLVTLLNDFKQVLIFSDKNIGKAGQLLANIDTTSLPSDRQQLLIDFKEKIPAFREYIGNAIDYSNFLLGVVGDKTAKRYIILLENNSELRATGGFPGTYAVAVFDQGYLKNILIDDIYNIDGQIKQNIVPPKPLAHITPNWGMRDANWFADFPTSANKVEEMYLKDGGDPVDGVLAITPDVISKILNIVGPIEMPEYGLTVTADNFVSEIQSEVEYGQNRAQPKTIVKELQPKLFAKLAGQDKDHWAQIFRALVEETEQKHILLYFNDPNLEMVARKNGLAGELKSTTGDYLDIVFSNVKGSKTDAVIKNSFELNETIDTDGGVNHTLTINRLHTGGGSQYGFYNKPNPSYIRIYVPKGSELKSIAGHTITDYKPLLSHQDFGFVKDPDLTLLEQNTAHPFADVDVYEEAGKTVFGFWLITKPQESKFVALTYRTPDIINEKGYDLLWQKQAGTGQDQLSYSFEIPEGKSATNLSDNLQLAGNKIFMSSDLSIDREISVGLK